MRTVTNRRMNTHDKRLRKKEAKRSRLRRIADGEEVEEEEEDEYSDDSEDDDGTDRREEVRVYELLSDIVEFPIFGIVFWCVKLFLSV